MTITITAFEASPDQGQGLARDMPVRWALEEAEQAYEVRLVSFAAMKQAAHLALQPFGQIPTYEDGDVALFESGAIVLHVALTSGGRLSADERATVWMFAALSTIEPTVVEREQVEFSERDRPWFEARLPLLDDRIRAKLKILSGRLGDAEWLESDFSAGDLLMISVLRRVDAPLLAEFPNLAAYVARGEARPAFRRAFAAQLAVFEASRR